MTCARGGIASGCDIHLYEFAVTVLIHAIDDTFIRTASLLAEENIGH